MIYIYVELVQESPKVHVKYVYCFWEKHTRLVFQ
jgi:hypothetical protein